MKFILILILLLYCTDNVLMKSENGLNLRTSISSETKNKLKTNTNDKSKVSTSSENKFEAKSESKLVSQTKSALNSKLKTNTKEQTNTKSSSSTSKVNSKQVYEHPQMLKNENRERDHVQKYKTVSSNRDVNEESSGKDGFKVATIIDAHPIKTIDKREMDEDPNYMVDVIRSHITRVKAPPETEKNILYQNKLNDMKNQKKQQFLEKSNVYMNTDTIEFDANQSINDPFHNTINGGARMVNGAFVNGYTAPVMSQQVGYQGDVGMPANIMGMGFMGTQQGMQPQPPPRIQDPSGYIPPPTAFSGNQDILVTPSPLQFQNGYMPPQGPVIMNTGVGIPINGMPGQPLFNNNVLHPNVFKPLDIPIPAFPTQTTAPPPNPTTQFLQDKINLHNQKYQLSLHYKNEVPKPSNRPYEVDPMELDIMIKNINNLNKLQIDKLYRDLKTQELKIEKEDYKLANQNKDYNRVINTIFDSQKKELKEIENDMKKFSLKVDDKERQLINKELEEEFGNRMEGYLTFKAKHPHLQNLDPSDYMDITNMIKRELTNKNFYLKIDEY